MAENDGKNPRPVAQAKLDALLRRKVKRRGKEQNGENYVFEIGEIVSPTFTVCLPSEVKT